MFFVQSHNSEWRIILQKLNNYTFLYLLDTENESFAKNFMIYASGYFSTWIVLKISDMYITCGHFSK